MNDATTTVGDLRREVGSFIDERDWSQFHSPKNLSMAIAIEAAELMEHFQWLTTEQASAVRESPEDMQQVRAELADIVCYSLSLANAMDIDISSALRDKMVKNAIKYPAERFRGRFR
jgi:NTP pyrophosphatase (non-canonical NTP hydrolase)